MTPTSRPPRAEVVGSLLRPPSLRRAVEAFYEEGHSAVLDEERSKDRSALTHIEDDAIRGGLSECVRGRLPLPEALRDELGVLLLASAVQHQEV